MDKTDLSLILSATSVLLALRLSAALVLALLITLLAARS